MTFRRWACSAVLLFIPYSTQAALLRWPVELEKPWTHMSSSFGPRLQASNDYRYEFHTGIDIAGETTDHTVAAADGEVYRLYYEGEIESPYPNGGNVVILKHNTTTPLRFHGNKYDVFYTVYFHLASIAEYLTEGADVAAGDVLGHIGQSGPTTFNHLHFEVRVGTLCSLRSSCNSTGFDPHIHPLRFLSYPQTNHLRLTGRVQKKNLYITLQTRRNEADINRIVVTTYQANGVILQQRFLNFSTRAGLNPTPHQAHYSCYLSNCLRPARYSTRSKHYKLSINYKHLLTKHVHGYTVLVCDVAQHCTAEHFKI